MIQLAVVHGYGMHQEDLTIAQLGLSLETFWIAQTPYKVCSKVSSDALPVPMLTLDPCWTVGRGNVQ